MDTKDKLTPTSHHEDDLEQLQEWRFSKYSVLLDTKQILISAAIIIAAPLVLSMEVLWIQTKTATDPYFLFLQQAVCQVCYILQTEKSDSWYPQYWSVCVSVMQLLLCNAIICSEIYTRTLNNSLRKICLFWPLEDVLFSDCGLFGSFQLAENQALCIKLTKPSRFFGVFSCIIQVDKMMAVLAKCIQIDGKQCWPYWSHIMYTSESEQSSWYRSDRDNRDIDHGQKLFCLIVVIISACTGHVLVTWS